MAKINTNANIPSIRLAESAAPDTPASGYFQVYAKTDGKLYCKNDAGTEICLSDAGDMDNPMTTAGDIIIGGVSGAPARLAAGTEDYVLTMGATSPEWATPAGGTTDAADVTYTPAVAADWDSDADPGDVDNALDQLAERVDDLEGAGGGGFTTGDVHEVEIDRQTLGADGNLNKASIPSGYDDIEIIALLRSAKNAATDDIYIYLNNDTTGSNYYRQRLNATGGTVSTAGADVPHFGSVPAATATAKEFAIVRILIPGYTSETKNKNILIETSYRSAASTMVVQQTHVNWENDDAVTQVTIQPEGYDTDKLVTGSSWRVILKKTES